MSAGLRLVERGDHRGHAAVHVDAVVGVADRGVEIGEQVRVLADHPGELADPAGQRGDVDVSGRSFSIPTAVPAC